MWNRVKTPWTGIAGPSEQVCHKLSVSNMQPESNNAGQSKTTSSTSTTKSNRCNLTFKKLNDVEMAKKRELGLCFQCNEKYNPTHQCKNKQLQLMILQPIEEGTELNG